MIIRGFRYKLDPTPEQEKQFRQFAGVCRLLYNLALDQRRDFWRQYQRQTGARLNYVAQARELTKLRDAFDWIAAVSQTCQQRALRGHEAHADTNAAAEILRRNTAFMRVEERRRPSDEARTTQGLLSLEIPAL